MLNKLQKYLKFFILSLFINFFLFLNVYAIDLKFKKIVELDGPWGMSFVNDKELILTEKSGKIKIVDIQNYLVSEILHNLNFLDDGQGGLLDIFYKDNFIWISYTEIREKWEISGFAGNITSTSIATGRFSKKK